MSELLQLVTEGPQGRSDQRSGVGSKGNEDMVMNRKDLPDWAIWEDEWTCKVDDQEGYLMTVKEFKDACEIGAFIDYDGMGDLVKDGKIIPVGIDGKWVKPSTRDQIPEDVTHILWYNR